MINRIPTTKSIPINIVGSSIFGRYPKMSSEKTYNMFISDNWMVPYSGYKTAISQSKFSNENRGRSIFTSKKLGKLIVVIQNSVFAVNIFYDQSDNNSFDSSVDFIGNIETTTGVVYICENNVPQVAICDGKHIYIYDPYNTHVENTFYIAPGNGELPTSPSSIPINFVPTYIDFHDTYFLVAAKNDKNYDIPANNTWRLSSINGSNGVLYFDSDPNTNANKVGLLSTKPDNTQAVVRFPSRGDMIFVMGSIVSEAWHDLGLQLFPYQRSPSFNIDYGCLSPATIARTDEIVVWLAQNENSGPIILASTGGEPDKITSDGIDFLLSQMSDPSDSRAFIYRQDGHLIYHINFYTDNLSLFYDFNTQKFFHACDENGNYFIAEAVAFFNNQYYFVTRNNGNLYAFDTIFTTYDGLEIPRIRICKSIKLPSQEYFIANDIGFTIEQGDTDYQMQTPGNGDVIEYVTPKVDLSISIDGGEAFSSKWSYNLNPIGKRKNRLMWWRLGAANDLTPMFEFWGLGRFVATDGIINIRQ